MSVTIEDSINIDDDAEIYGDLNYTGLIEANMLKPAGILTITKSYDI